MSRKRSRQCDLPRKKNQRDTFNTYTHKVLKQVHPDAGITSNAMSVIETLLQNIFDRYVDEVGRLLRLQKQVTVNARDLQTATTLILGGDLAKHAISEGVKAVTTFNNNKEQKSDDNYVSRSKEAGLQFPVGRVERLMREQRIAKRVGGDAPVFMAAVLEYVAAELLELAGNAAKDHKMQRIKPRHILLAVRADEELKDIFSGNFACAGVAPHIQKALLPPQKKAKKQ